MKYVPISRKKYQEEIIPALMKDFGYKSIMQVPCLKKISLNQGMGIAITDKKFIDSAV